MGCVTANIGSTGGCLTAKISRVGKGIKANVQLADEHLIATINRVGKGLKANIGLICTPNSEAYIKVTPEVLWFFKENENLNVDVMSNIKWIVK